MAEARAARATLRDVARLAEVSTSTVSNVMNGYPYIADATRRRVLDAVVATGYRPSRAGQVLRSGRSNLVPLAVPDLRTLYFAQLAHDLGAEARRRGFVLVVIETAADRERELRAAEGYDGTAAAGVLLYGTGTTSEEVRNAAGRTPVLTIGRPVEQPWIDHFVVGTGASAQVLVDHLVAQGRLRFAYAGSLTGQPSSLSTQHVRGLRAALDRRGLSLPETALLPLDGLGRHDGAAAAQVLAASGQRFDVLITEHAQTAVGVLRGLAAAGVAVPGQVAVAAWGGSEESEFTSPPLTTVDQDHEALAPMVFDALVARIADPHRPPGVQPIPWRLSVRASTG